MKKTVVSLLFTGIFMAVCLLPLAGLLLAGPSAPVANEIPAAKPALVDRDGALNGDYLADAAAYLGERFCLRPECITAWARLNAALFRTSVTQDVVLGSDGWLYYAPTLDDYARSAPMSGRELWCAARTLYLLQEHARSLGGDFLFTAAPNKNSLYAANMPAFPVDNRLSNAQVLARRLEEMGVTYLDLFAVFEEQAEVLYFPTDSHWNGRGAALAADAILAALGRESGYFAAGFLPAEHRGDLYEMLYPAGREADPDFVPAAGFTFTGGGKNPDAITITTECASSSGSLVMYRDSFGRNLYPYLAESFGSAVFSRKNDYGSVALSPGDVLVVELVERNLRYLNEYAPALPAPVRENTSAFEAAAAGSMALTAEAEGEYLSLRGRFADVVPDEDSPVYALCAGILYEAAPQPDGFRLCLPEGTDPEGIRVIFTAGGNRIALEGVIEYR